MGGRPRAEWGCLIGGKKWGVADKKPQLAGVLLPYGQQLNLALAGGLSFLL